MIICEIWYLMSHAHQDLEKPSGKIYSSLLYILPDGLSKSWCV